MKHYSPSLRGSVIGLLFIKFVKKLWKKWLTIGHIIGSFQLQVIFSLFYLTLLSVAALFVRFGMDPLRVSRRFLKNKKSLFTVWEHEDETLESAKRQY